MAPRNRRRLSPGGPSDLDPDLHDDRFRARGPDHHVDRDLRVDRVDHRLFDLFARQGWTEQVAVDLVVEMGHPFRVPSPVHPIERRPA